MPFIPIVELSVIMSTSVDISVKVEIVVVSATELSVVEVWSKSIVVDEGIEVCCSVDMDEGVYFLEGISLVRI